MNQSLILIPLVGMFFLTFIVFIYMYYTRIRGIRTLGVYPQTRADLDRLPPRAVNVAANFQNLFELPVVFYACVLTLYMMHRVDVVHLLCAYGFLLFRVAHSVIHCTYNRVMQRFSVYVIASVFLWVMVLRLALDILT